jgi:DNA-binding transcriptional MocR family regulator
VAGWAVAARPPCGFFSWVQLPPPLRAKDVIALAEAEFGVTAMVGERCSPTAEAGALLADRVRLCFAFLPPADLVDGVRRLALAVAAARAAVALDFSL